MYGHITRKVVNVMDSISKITYINTDGMTELQKIYYYQLINMIKHSCKYDLFIKGFIDKLNYLLETINK